MSNIDGYKPKAKPKRQKAHTLEMFFRSKYSVMGLASIPVFRFRLNYRIMVDTNEKDEIPKPNLSPEKSEAQSVIPPSSILNNIEEDNEEEEEEYEEEEDDEEEEEVEFEEEEEEEEDDDEPEEEEKVNKEETSKQKEDEKKVKEPKNGEELVETSKSKEKRQNNTKKTITNGEKPESSTKKKSSKRVESMGMVFMCSSKTKTDCFRYKILGLPANKQDQVAKIYKGMRLFLFDVDLRLMYGIFKAAGPGGYNIQPKAFKSEFPSQVRFTVLDDCLPVAEEKFKEILKENYYTRSKFESILKADQVKKLCKLFAVTSKGQNRLKPSSKPRRIRPIESRRIRTDERRIRNREDESRERKKRKIRTRDDERRFRPRSRSRSRSRSPPRRETRRYDDYERPPVLYERAAPVVRYLPPPPLSPARSYPYDRPPPPYDHRGYHDEMRAREWDRDRDPYYVYALPPEYHIVSREYRPPPPQLPPPEYRLSRRTPPEYRDVGPPPPEYRSHRTHYRY